MNAPGGGRRHGGIVDACDLITDATDKHREPSPHATHAASLSHSHQPHPIKPCKQFRGGRSM